MKLYKCELCLKIFKRKQHLISHLNRKNKCYNPDTEILTINDINIDQNQNPNNEPNKLIEKLPDNEPNNLIEKLPDLTEHLHNSIELPNNLPNLTELPEKQPNNLPNLTELPENIPNILPNLSNIEPEIIEVVDLPINDTIIQLKKRNYNYPIIQPEIQPEIQPIIQPIIKPVFQPEIQPIIQPINEPKIDQIIKPIIQPINEPKYKLIPSNTYDITYEPLKLKLDEKPDTNLQKNLQNCERLNQYKKIMKFRKI